MLFLLFLFWKTQNEGLPVCDLTKIFQSVVLYWGQVLNLTLDEHMLHQIGFCSLRPELSFRHLIRDIWRLGYALWIIPMTHSWPWDISHINRNDELVFYDSVSGHILHSLNNPFQEQRITVFGTLSWSPLPPSDRLICELWIEPSALLTLFPWKENVLIFSERAHF